MYYNRSVSAHTELAIAHSHSDCMLPFVTWFCCIHIFSHPSRALLGELASIRIRGEGDDDYGIPDTSFNLPQGLKQRRLVLVQNSDLYLLSVHEGAVFCGHRNRIDASIIKTGLPGEDVCILRETRVIDGVCYGVAIRIGGVRGYGHRITFMYQDVWDSIKHRRMQQAVIAFFRIEFSIACGVLFLAIIGINNTVAGPGVARLACCPSKIGRA